MAEIKYSNWTNDGIMRAPIFLRFREDKKPEECTIEDERHVEEVVVTNTNTNTNTTKDQYREAFKQRATGIIMNNDTVQKMDKNISSHSLSSSTSTLSSSSSALSSSYPEFSNLGKVFWPKTKEHPELTKGNLIEYYDKISKYILPHLQNRPLSLSRYPDGIEGKHFYHKNWDKEKPAYVETIKIYSKSTNNTDKLSNL